MLTVACCLWDANTKTQAFSLGYDESWVEKLYRGFARNLTRPFQFVCFSEKPRLLPYAIKQERLRTLKPDYGCLIEPFRLNEPMILCGLDTVVVGNVDHFADYCLNEERLALPRNPYNLEQSINGIALVPRGHKHIYDAWRGENDMEWLRRFPWRPIDDLWPGEVLSLKAHRVRDVGLNGARVIYMHGTPKQPALMHLEWMRRHWA